MKTIKFTLIAGVMLVTAISTLTTEAASKTATAEDMAFELISKYEGFRSNVYVCPGGRRTIGYGFTDQALLDKKTITKAEADAILRKKIRTELEWVNKQVKGLTPKQQAAVCSFVYNLGRGNFNSSTFKKELVSKNMGGASKECQRWVYSNGRILNGLRKRRAAEAALLV